MNANTAGSTRKYANAQPSRTAASPTPGSASPAASHAGTGPARRRPRAGTAMNGIAMNSATKNASLSGVRNGEATSVAIIVPPCGRCLISGCRQPAVELVRERNQRDQDHQHRGDRLQQTLAQLDQVREKGPVRAPRPPGLPASASPCGTSGFQRWRRDLGARLRQRRRGCRRVRRAPPCGASCAAFRQLGRAASALRRPRVPAAFLRPAARARFPPRTLCQLVRARRTSAPTVRATRGRRSGPSTSSATTAISAISPKPTSNMTRSGPLLRFGRVGLVLGLRRRPAADRRSGSRSDRSAWRRRRPGPS